MSTIIRLLRNINPLNNSLNRGKSEYVISKILAFLFIYLSAAVIMESIIILILFLSGYDFLHGEMPKGEWANLLPLYGFSGFAILTILYVKFIEKQRLSSIKLEWKIKILKAFIKGFAIGSILVIFLISILLSTGDIKYTGMGKVSKTIVIWLFAYMVQGVSEEIMCRGFLLNSLIRKVSTGIAIFISSGAFLFPHISSLLGINNVSTFVAIINLLLISILFSLAMIKEDSIGIACGIHVGWNFFLSCIFGLQVSGSKSTNGVIKLIIQPVHTYITGGIYGIEASILLVPILLILDAVYILWIKGNRNNHGI